MYVSDNEDGDTLSISVPFEDGSTTLEDGGTVSTSVHGENEANSPEIVDRFTHNRSNSSGAPTGARAIRVHFQLTCIDYICFIFWFFLISFSVCYGLVELMRYTINTEV